jgi:hypothetical protein
MSLFPTILNVLKSIKVISLSVPMFMNVPTPVSSLNSQLDFIYKFLRLRTVVIFP